MIHIEIEKTVVRLKAICHDGQLTDGQRGALERAIKELEGVADACKGDHDAKRVKRLIHQVVNRIGWWLLLRYFDWPDGTDSES